jgi:riboflavin synthase
LQGALLRAASSRETRGTQPRALPMACASDAAYTRQPMFTGIVEKCVRVIGVADGPKFNRLTLAVDWTDVKPGDSVAVNGVCLTVAEKSPGQLAFDVVQETLDKTNLKLVQQGDEVHVERSLRVGDRIDGHFVQGHVDGAALLVEQLSDENQWRLRCQAPHELAKYLVAKGSVCLDGVSLTLAAVRGSEFEVALIPTTVNRTTLARRAPGWPFNLEADVISKTVVSWLERQRA